MIHEEDRTVADLFGLALVVVKTGTPILVDLPESTPSF
jgi:hypothetical protein